MMYSCGVYLKDLWLKLARTNTQTPCVQKITENIHKHMSVQIWGESVAEGTARSPASATTTSSRWLWSSGERKPSRAAHNEELGHAGERRSSGTRGRGGAKVERWCRVLDCRRRRRPARHRIERRAARVPPGGWEGERRARAAVLVSVLFLYFYFYFFCFWNMFIIFKKCLIFGWLQRAGPFSNVLLVFFSWRIYFSVLFLFFLFIFLLLFYF